MEPRIKGQMVEASQQCLTLYAKVEDEGNLQRKGKGVPMRCAYLLDYDPQHILS